MSDETPPSPLRLRPRPRPEGETPAAASGAEEGKLRLKPKLSVEAEPEVAAEPEYVENEPPVEPVRAKPKLTLDPEPEPELEPEAEAVVEEAAVEAPAETEVVAEAGYENEEAPPAPEEGRVKLKIKVPGAVTQETGESVEAGEEPPSLPPFPVVAPPPPEAEEIDAPPLLAEVSAPPFPGAVVAKPSPGGSRPAVFKRPRVPAALLAAERRKRMLKYAAIAVGGVLLAGAVIGGAFLKFTPPPSAVHLPPRPAYVAPVEPVVVAPVIKVVPPPQLPVEPVSSERVSSTATVELAPGVTATTESIKAVPNASAAFRTFVATAKISGVYQGANPRAFINGRMVRTGEMVEEMMEIHFDSVDSATRSIIFKDSSGATVSRRY